MSANNTDKNKKIAKDDVIIEVKGLKKAFNSNVVLKKY